MIRRRPEPVSNLQLSCPACCEPKQWETQWVYANSFDGLCKACGHWWQSPLPEIKPKIIVLDTNVLSEITKLSLPDFPSERLKKLERWKEVAIRLERANLLQAIACPETPTLDRELTLTKYGPAVKAKIQMFANGLRYPERDAVICQQLYAAAFAYRQGISVERVKRRDVLVGHMDEWQSPFRAQVDFGQRNDPSEVRDERENLHASMGCVFSRWNRGCGSIDQIYNDERLSYGPETIRLYHHCLEMMKKGYRDPFHPIWDRIKYVRMGLEKAGVPRTESAAKMEAFMLTPAASYIPANQISAALYAYEACQIAGGMKKPKSSMGLDIEMLSTVLPYCDAVLIECHFAQALRSTGRLLPAECRSVKIFSIRELHSFVNYIDELIAAVPEDQRRAAEAIYQTG